MKKILIYGDSNVWGDNFLTGKRIKDKYQWANILNKNLGRRFKVLQEGLPGRIAGNEEKEKTYKNGKESFIPIFRTSGPVDYILIMLGTNDLQNKYNKSSQDIINDLLWYYNSIEKEFEDDENKIKYFVKKKMPKFIYILPINFDYKVNASIIFNKESEQKRQDIINNFPKETSKYEIISLNNMELFDDGIHLNLTGHEKLANIVKDYFINEK